MTTLGPWVVAIVLYGIFRLWYDRRRPVLTAAEVDTYVRRIEESALETSPQRLAALRHLLANDDGREIFMVNLLRLQPGEVCSPGSDLPQPPAQVLERYTRPFLAALLRRAGHPLLVAQGVGPCVEQWGMDEMPDWNAAGIIRYRSRRDLVELVVDPRFADLHSFKSIALERTFAFPSRPRLLAGGPRLVVALALGWIAALF